MVLPHKIPAIYTVILLLLLQASIEAKKPKRRICPIGFEIAYTKITELPICYRLKGPEKITDTFKECSGNLYTVKLYDSLNITNYTEKVLWTEYKSAYPGGPFIDTSYTPSVGSLLDSSFDVTNSHYGIDEELCVVKDPAGNYTADRCDKEYYRYCFVEPYTEEVTDEGCEELKGTIRFWSPKSICLLAATAVGGRTVRATWLQSKEICAKRGAEILYNGWRYSNSPLLYGPDTHKDTVYPFHLTYDTSHSSTNRNGMDFVRLSATDTDVDADLVMYGALRNGICDMVNSSYIFNYIICEKDVEEKKAAMTLTVDEQNKLILTVSHDVNESSIFCFTDSKTYYPTPVKISFESNYNNLLTYVLKPESDGYYWCVNIDSKRFRVSASKKLPWIREEQSLKSTYAVQLLFHKKYTFYDVNEISKIWEKKLNDYIFYSTHYYNVNGEFDRIQNPKLFQETLENFKEQHPELKAEKKDKIFGMKIKKIYMDGKTAVIHFQLPPTMRPVLPGWWSNMRVNYMKPVNFCTVEGQDFVSTLTVGCLIHTCVGSFNDGMQAVTLVDETCMMNTYSSQPYEETKDVNRDLSNSSEATKQEPTTSTETNTENTATTGDANPTMTTTTTYRLETTTEGVVTAATSSVITKETVITTLPHSLTSSAITQTPTILPPKEQLLQVMQNLENLVNNDTAEVSVDAISGSFDRVDELLSENLSLAIPGDLLHLLDGIGARLDLNGSIDAQVVRSNVALLVANAKPDLPVNGLRIAAKADGFSGGAFEIIRSEVNLDYLSASSSEAVVHLPSSVANSSRRISFVVFRNDRAFQTNSTLMAVNSRVLSINVENVTEFKTGETIDIHFSPLMGDPDRNQTRTCAYWNFNDHDGGHWFTEGCQFIAATGAGKLDTCRCTHLRHFAEILVSRTLYSELDEQTSSQSASSASPSSV